MILYILVEEPSIKKVLDEILPKILPDNVTWHILIHQGKSDLKNALKNTLPSLCKMPEARIIVTCDQDNDNCENLKSELIQLVGNRCNAPILYRIICRELECWFLGDLSAVKGAFPRFNPGKYENKTQYRKNVDKIQNPDTMLLNIIPEYKRKKSLPKIETAGKVAKYLSIDENRSASFQNFISGVQKLISNSDQ